MLDVKPGHVVYRCHGCDRVVNDLVDKLRTCFEVNGKSLCPQCRREYRGVFSERNKALLAVHCAILANEIPKPKDPGEQKRYIDEVRRLTDLEYARYTGGIDPERRAERTATYWTTSYL